MKKYYVIVPETLCIDKILNQSITNTSNYNVDYFYWLVSQVLTKNTYDFEGNIENEWKALCSKILEKHPYNYKEHLRFLCSNQGTFDKILWRKEYSVGQCYSYKLSPSYFISKARIYEITDKKLLKYFKKLRPDKIVYNNKFKRRYKFLAKYFNNNDLEIDESGAIMKNDALFKTGYFDPTKKVFKQRNNLKQICSILNQEFNINYNNKTDGRIHTLITSLSKPLRHYITYHGKELAEVDLTNSVPLFCYYILKAITNSNSNKYLDTIIHQSKIKYPFKMFSEGANILDKKEVEAFGKKVLNGTFYDCFVDELSLLDKEDKDFDKDEYLKKKSMSIFNTEKIEPRKVMKKIMLSMMNAKIDQYKIEQKIFKNQFPTILQWINGFKKENHKLFSYLMLQTESYFILDIVARKINSNPRINIPIITLHDCLITTKSNLDTLYCEMQNILNRELGFTPKLTKKEW